MLLTELTFHPTTQTSRLDGQLADAVQALCAAWFKNGQLWGEPLFGWVEENLRVVCYLPESNALHDALHSPWARRELERVAAVTRRSFECHVVDDRAGRHRATDWRETETLALYTHRFDETSPVVAGRNLPVPLYSLPIDESVRSDLMNWMQTFRELDGIQLGCGPLEHAAHAQLSGHDGELATEGRRLAGLVERATRKTTYYYLLPNAPGPSTQQQGCCPACGVAWMPSGIGADDSQDFPRRCLPCRLVTDLPVSTSDDTLVTD